jgi:uncharacterized membrane protein YczE
MLQRVEPRTRGVPGGRDTRYERGSVGSVVLVQEEFEAASNAPVDALRDRVPERLARCVAGLAVFGVGISLVIEARLGSGPWDVLHQGISKRTGISLGTVLVVVGLLLLLLWIPLRQRPGIGTILNAVEIGIVADIVIALVPAPDNLALRWLLLALGITATAIGSGIYIGAGLGSGPRDGIMMGLTRHGLSVRVARTSIEVTVVVLGFLLGGKVGLGTVAFALLIGPLVHVFLPRFRMRGAARSEIPAPA